MPTEQDTWIAEEVLGWTKKDIPAKWIPDHGWELLGSDDGEYLRSRVKGWMDAKGNFKVWVDEFSPTTNDADALMALIEWPNEDRAWGIEWDGEKYDVSLEEVYETEDKFCCGEWEANGETIKAAICEALKKWKEEQCQKNGS